MGFEYCIVLLAPGRWEERKPAPARPPPEASSPNWPGYPVIGEGPLWEPVGVIAANRATSLSVLVDPSFAHCRPGSRGWAAICLANVIFRELPPLLIGSPRERFAPNFAVEPERGEEGWPLTAYQFIGERCRLGQVSGGESFVLPTILYGTYPEPLLPEKETIDKHNAALALDDEPFRALVNGERYDFFGGRRRAEHPVPWVSCGRLAAWLQSLVNGEKIAGQTLAQDARALALVRGWAGLVGGIATIGGRALILFESPKVPTLA